LNEQFADLQLIQDDTLIKIKENGSVRELEGELRVKIDGIIADFLKV